MKFNNSFGEGVEVKTFGFYFKPRGLVFIFVYNYFTTLKNRGTNFVPLFSFKN